MAVTLPFVTTKPILVRLAAVTATALGLPAATDVQLFACALVDGWLQADFRETNGDITRYVLPSESLLYVKQLQTVAEAGSTAPAPQTR